MTVSLRSSRLDQAVEHAAVAQSGQRVDGSVFGEAGRLVRELKCPLASSMKDGRCRSSSRLAALNAGAEGTSGSF